MPAVEIKEDHVGHEEHLNPEPYVIDVKDYVGNSLRLQGINELRKAGAQTPEPFLVIPDCAFQVWQNEGMTDSLRNQFFGAFDQITVANPGEGVHLGFRANREEQELRGPRSSAISDPEELVAKIEEAWQFAVDRGYETEGAEIDLCLHNFLNATQPPRKDKPGLFWPGGDVILLPDGATEIRAIPGADEAAQLFTKVDVYVVRFDGPWDTGKPSIEPEIVEKPSTLVPVEGGYADVDIPADYQKQSTLDFDAVIEIARLHQRLCQTHKPRRLEFIVREGEVIIRECVPFDVRQEDLVFLEEETVQPMIVLHSEEDLKLVEPPVAMVYLAPETLHLERERRRRLFDSLAHYAKRGGIELFVFASTRIQTCHEFKTFKDLDQSVFFVGREEFKPGELVRAYREDKVPKWARVKEKRGFILELEDSQDPELVGGKAANLAILAENGFLVPDGFCITTEAFDQYLDFLGLKEAVEELNHLDGEALEEQISEVQETIIGGEMPPSLAEQIEEKLSQFKVGQFAVRSSANVEDGRATSRATFAGKFETFLDTPFKEVTDKIKACWASAFSARAVRHAISLEIPPSKIKMAALIQGMIKSQTGGVIHTKDIETGSPHIIITAGKSAEAVTSREGEETFHQIIIEREPLGIIGEDLPIAVSPFLTREESLNLATLALQIEDVFEQRYQERRYQDIEWAIDKDGEPVIFQTRPLPRF